RTFDQIAKDKGLEFVIERHKYVPAALTTDPTRLQQILKNLLSNAFKFTAQGRVTLEISMMQKHHLGSIQGPAIALAVKDTGIGIPPDKFNVIFEAFQQADMGTSRKFGGTGLGLGISREIAGLLGGEIGVESTLNEGSTFTLYHPLERTAASSQTRILTPDALRLPRKQASREIVMPAAYEVVRDDRESIETSDRVLLIIE